MNELTMNLATNVKMPLYEQIYQYIKADIQCGKIPCGEKLPSTRALAKHLAVSRSTVELSYKQLLSEGYIESVPCRGFFVAQIEELHRIGPVGRRARAPEVKKEEYRYDFTPHGVDLKSFPYNVWRRLSKDILQDDKTELFRLGDSKGEYEFREAIAGYLYEARGVSLTPEQIIVGAGSDYMLMLLGIVLGTGIKIAFEDPAYKQAYRLMKHIGYEPVPVPMDGNGMSVSALKGSGAQAAYVTPSHQYPTGIVMPVKRRMELLRWAEEGEGRYIIEDDYDSEFRYKGKPIPALKGYDRNEKVIYLGTFSKSIAPAIRLSYMALPEPLMEKYDRSSRFISSSVSKVDQHIVSRFIRDGHYERHLNKMRALYKGRHDALIDALKPLAAHCRISGEHAGVHLLINFHDGKTEAELIERAKDKGVLVYGLSDYRIGGSTGQEAKGKMQEATIVLGYAGLTEEQIKEAAEILVSCWT